MKRIAALTAVAAMTLAGATFTPTTEAQADPAKARACLDQLITGAVANGMRLRALDGDSSAPEEEVSYRVTLYKGMTYLLLACADGENVDLDVRLYDESGNLVDNDKSPDAQPFVSVMPEVTGEYALQVMVYKADQPKTDFAVAIAYQY